MAVFIFQERFARLYIVDDVVVMETKRADLWGSIHDPLDVKLALAIRHDYCLPALGSVKGRVAVDDADF